MYIDRRKFTQAAAWVSGAAITNPSSLIAEEKKPAPKKDITIGILGQSATWRGVPGFTYAYLSNNTQKEQIVTAKLEVKMLEGDEEGWTLNNGTEDSQLVTIPPNQEEIVFWTPVAPNIGKRNSGSKEILTITNGEGKEIDTRTSTRGQPSIRSADADRPPVITGPRDVIINSKNLPKYPSVVHPVVFWNELGTNYSQDEFKEFKFEVTNVVGKQKVGWKIEPEVNPIKNVEPLGIGVFKVTITPPKTVIPKENYLLNLKIIGKNPKDEKAPHITPVQVAVQIQ